MGSHDANISRDMFDERKRYTRGIVQQQIPWVDADENDSSESIFTYHRRVVQSTFQDGYVNDGFKIKECDNDGIRYNGNVNNFAVVGQTLSISPRTVAEGKDAGAYFIEGLRCVLFGDVIYSADDPIPDQVGDPDKISQESIFPRVTDIEYTGGNTVITDSAQNYVVDELVGRNITFLNGGALGVYPVAANTATTITVNGTDLTGSVYVYNRYRINLSAPSGSDRTDAVYLNVYLDEINAAEDPNLYHSLGMPTEAQLREQIIQEILVREDVATHGELTDYVDTDGNQHYVQKIVEIDRLDGDNTITAAMIQADNTVQFGSILQNSPFQTYGSSQHANDSGAVDNMPVNGTWPNAPITVPDGGYWIAREEDDQANKAGYYSNVTGTWTWMFAVEIENASDIIYDNATSGLAAIDVQDAIDEVDSDLDDIAGDSNLIAYDNNSSGIDTYISSPTTVDDALSQLSAGIENSAIVYTMKSGDGYTEFSAMVTAISSAGTPAQITFEPGTYTMVVTSVIDFGTAEITIKGYGRTVSNIVFSDAAFNKFKSTKNITLMDISIREERTTAGIVAQGQLGVYVQNCTLWNPGTVQQELQSANEVRVSDTELYGVVINAGQKSILSSSVFWNPTVSTYTMTMGQDSSIVNSTIIDPRLDLVQGDNCVCSLVGDSSFRKLTQGQHCNFSAPSLAFDGDYSLQAGDTWFIKQDHYSTISNTYTSVANLDPVESVSYLIWQRQSCHMSGVSLYFTVVGSTWSTTGRVINLIHNEDTSTLDGVSINGGMTNTWSGDNMYFIYFNLGNYAKMSSCVVSVTGTVTNTGTGNIQGTSNTAYMSSCSINTFSGVESIVDVTFMSACYIDGSIPVSSLKASSSYVTGDVVGVKHMSACYIQGDVTCGSGTPVQITGSQISGNVIGNGNVTACSIANNYINGNVSGGGSHLTDNTIIGTTAGTWAQQHNNI